MCFYGRIFWNCKRHEMPAIFLQSCTQAFFTARSEGLSAGSTWYKENCAVRNYLWKHESSKPCPYCLHGSEDDKKEGTTTRSGNDTKEGTATEKKRPSEAEMVKRQEREAQELAASIGTQPECQESLAVYADYWAYVAERYGVGLDTRISEDDEEEDTEDWLDSRRQVELG